jgi:hypothetical protein
MEGRNTVGPEACTMKKYPDMSKLFALKEERRRKLANLPITEKMEIAQRLQEISRHAPGLKARVKEKRAKWSVVAMQPKIKKYG